MVNQPIGNHGLGIFWCGWIIIGPRGLQCETNLQEIMCCECSDVVRFDLGPLLQGQTNVAKLKSAYNSLIIGPRGSGW